MKPSLFNQKRRILNDLAHQDKAPVLEMPRKSVSEERSFIDTSTNRVLKTTESAQRVQSGRFDTPASRSLGVNTGLGGTLTQAALKSALPLELPQNTRQTQDLPDPTAAEYSSNGRAADALAGARAGGRSLLGKTLDPYALAGAMLGGALAGGTSSRNSIGQTYAGEQAYQADLSRTLSSNAGIMEQEDLLEKTKARISQTKIKQAAEERANRRLEKDILVANNKMSLEEDALDEKKRYNDATLANKRADQILGMMSQTDDDKTREELGAKVIKLMELSPEIEAKKLGVTSKDMKVIKSDGVYLGVLPNRKVVELTKEDGSLVSALEPKDYLKLLESQAGGTQYDVAKMYNGFAKQLRDGNPDLKETTLSARAGEMVQEAIRQEKQGRVGQMTEQYLRGYQEKLKGSQSNQQSSGEVPAIPALTSVAPQPEPETPKPGNAHTQLNNSSPVQNSFGSYKVEGLELLGDGRMRHGGYVSVTDSPRPIDTLPRDIIQEAREKPIGKKFQDPTSKVIYMRLSERDVVEVVPN